MSGLLSHVQPFLRYQTSRNLVVDVWQVSDCAVVVIWWYGGGKVAARWRRGGGEGGCEGGGEGSWGVVGGSASSSPYPALPLHAQPHPRPNLVHPAPPRLTPPYSAPDSDSAHLASSRPASPGLSPPHPNTPRLTPTPPRCTPPHRLTASTNLTPALPGLAPPHPASLCLSLHDLDSPRSTPPHPS